VDRTVLMSAIMIDLDHFKRLNAYGHRAGDDVFREVAPYRHGVDAGDRHCSPLRRGNSCLMLLLDCPLDNAVRRRRAYACRSTR
jgi:diguanylate cyclase (GGDEF)-like protein